MQVHELAIQTEKLSKAYGDIYALRGVDLAVPRRSITGFLGPNGAGKSTLIKLLLGLRKPTTGRGTVFGMDIVKESTSIRYRTGYLAQSPHFYPNLTARETLRFVARFFYDDPAQVERAVAESLELVDLTEKADRAVKGFSGGERQRLGIAQAQINQPELLILDEPAAALDPMGRVQVLAIMERLRDKSTIFYSTHILDDVQRISDRVVILNHGELVAQGPVETLLAGEGGTVYRMALVGDSSATFRRITDLPWVEGVQQQQRNGYVQWDVTVTDEEIAQSQLLRLVLDQKEVDVVSFGRAQYELEDVFMELVEGR